jgi:pyridoxine/pyridoxamine 5'-phosphate oxidase
MTDAFETVHQAKPNDGIYVPPFYNDLALSLAHAWSLLARGTADRRSPFHAPVVASVGLDGAPQQRTMILRKVDVATRTLRFNTDTRSAKWQELATNPQISIVGYSAADKIQLRLSGRATLDVDSTLAENVWANMRDQSRVAYAQPAAPGSEVAQPDAYVPPLELRKDDPAAAVARAHFCLLTVQIDCLDWVYLHLNGNRRAQFRWTSETPAGAIAVATNARWLAP